MVKALMINISSFGGASYNLIKCVGKNGAGVRANKMHWIIPSNYLSRKPRYSVNMNAFILH